MELYLSYKGESQKKIEKLEMELQQYKDRLKEEDDSVWTIEKLENHNANFPHFQIMPKSLSAS